MLEMGIIVGIGLIVTLAKASWGVKLWMTSNPGKVDVFIAALLFAIHWGTFSGGMVATVGALFASIVMTIARKAIGYKARGKYIRGWFDFSHKLGG